MYGSPCLSCYVLLSWLICLLARMSLTSFEGIGIVLCTPQASFCTLQYSIVTHSTLLTEPVTVAPQSNFPELLPNFSIVLSNITIVQATPHMPSHTYATVRPNFPLNLILT